MSRPVAGIRGKTVIVTLPGSPKGAVESLDAIRKLLPHACRQAAGEDSRRIHAVGMQQLEKQAGLGPETRDPKQERHSHHHHHDPYPTSHGHVIPKAHTRPEDRPISNDPSAGPSNRYRASPYPMLSIDEALKVVAEHVPGPTISSIAVGPALVGHILAEDVRASEDVPAFRASIVDGYAIHIPEGSSSATGTFSVSSILQARPTRVSELDPSTVARITTGAPLPPGSNAVVMVEDTAIKALSASGTEELAIEILTAEVQPGENVREAGSDIAAGSTILHRGDLITAVGGELGLLASMGVAAVSVYRKPVVAVLSTGDEIVPHDLARALRLGEVRDCNRPALLAAVRSWGYEVLDLGIAKDSLEDLETHLRHALTSASLIVTTGGASMGELDLLKPVLERSLAATIHFGRVALKPGKPTTFASIPIPAPTTTTTTTLALSNSAATLETCPLLSLPGNPVSALVCAWLFARLACRKLSGACEHPSHDRERPPASLRSSSSSPPPPPPLSQLLPTVPVYLAHAVRCDPVREEFVRAALAVSDDDGRMWATLTGGQRSSRVGSLKGAQGLLRLPAKTEDAVLQRGTRVQAVLLDVPSFDGGVGGGRGGDREK